MNPIRFLPLVLKTVLRQRTRALLTLLGVAVAMFLFATVQSLQVGVREATEATAKDTTLVVYRENRFCPFTSRLPEDYDRRIRTVPGVVDVVPMQIAVSNCRTSLDVVVFRGVRKEPFLEREAAGFRIVAGSVEDWGRRTDAAIVGRTLADRRGFKPGDRFDSSGITVTVAAVYESDEAQHQNVAYVDLEFLQRAPGVGKDGIVTQFNVRVDDPQRLEEIAAAIDAEFADAQEPTSTRSEKAFVARAAKDVVELVAFTRWVGLASVLAVIALIANSIVLSVQDRVRDYGVLRTLGFGRRLIAGLIVTEGFLLGVFGGALGKVAAVVVIARGDWALSTEGLSIDPSVGTSVWLGALGVSVVVGILAGAVPAVRAGRLDIVETFRAV